MQNRREQLSIHSIYKNHKKVDSNNKNLFFLSIFCRTWLTAPLLAHLWLRNYFFFCCSSVRVLQSLSSSGRCIVLLVASRWMETQRLRARFRRLKPYFDGRITWSRFPQRQPCPLSAGISLFAVVDDISVNCVNEA